MPKRNKRRTGVSFTEAVWDIEKGNVWDTWEIIIMKGYVLEYCMTKIQLSTSV